MLAKAREFYERALDLDPGNVDALVGARAGGHCSQLRNRRSVPLQGCGGGETVEGIDSGAEPCVRPRRDGRCALRDQSGRARHRGTGAGVGDRPQISQPHALTSAASTHTSTGRGRNRGSRAGSPATEPPRYDPPTLGSIISAGRRRVSANSRTRRSWFRRSIDVNHNNLFAYFNLAACLAHLGRIDEARREAEAGLAVDAELYHPSIPRRRRKRQRRVPCPARAHHRRHAPGRESPKQ